MLIRRRWTDIAVWEFGCLGSFNWGLFHFGFIWLTSRLLVKRLFDIRAHGH